MALTINQAIATQVSLAYLGRPQDVGALTTFGLGLATGPVPSPTAAQLKDLFATAESKVVFGASATMSSVISKSFELVGRTATAQNITDIVTWANSAKLDISQLPWEIMKIALSTESLLPQASQVAWARLSVAYQFAEDISANSTALQSLATSTTQQDAARAVISGVTSFATIATAYPSTGSGTAANFVSGASSTAGQTFTLTTGADVSGLLQSDVVKSSSTTGNDTFTGTVGITAATFAIGDTLDGGSGADTLVLNDAVTTPAAYTLAMPVGASVKSMETLTVNGSLGVTADTTVAAWAAAGITKLNVTGTDDLSIVAAATTDVAATASALSSDGTAAAELSVNGGKNVTTVSADSVTLTAGPATSGQIIIGATTAAKGAVSVTHTETGVDAAGNVDATGSTIAITGGTTVTVSSLVVVGASDNAGDTMTHGAVGVTGNADTTSVTVNQTAAAARSATAVGIINGAVTIADVNAADATKAGSIASVSLTNFGNSTVDSSALTSVTLGGTGGTMGIGRGALTAVPTANTLALNTNTLTGTNTITDSEAAADDGFTTINLTNTGTTVIADLVAADMTTLNIAGSGSLKLTANTLGGALTTTVVSTSTGTVELAGALTAAANYTGAAGVDKVTAGAAATGTINTGAGDDTITASTLGTGTINGGDGTADTLLMAAADAATATASAAFAAKVTNVERLSLGAYTDAAGVTVNLANMNNYNHVTSAGGATAVAARAQAISGFTTGGTFNQTALFDTNQNVTLSGAGFSAGTTDTFNLGMTGTDGYANLGVLTLADIETLNITTTDSDTTAATTAFDANIDSTSVKTVVVTGNAGMTFANSDLGTALTTFNASGVTVGPVTYTTAALAAAATITGGAGADTLNGASAAVAGVTINGGAGNDTITGSATKANTLNGGDGNDSITGGGAADVIDGGAGTNTYVFSSANVAEQAGSGTTSGAVINLSADALTASAVFTASGAYLTLSQASVAAGTSTYLFSNESNTNASVIDTLANINNVTGTNLADYIVGSATANTITGGVGIDRLTGGSGADTFVTTVGAAYTTAAADTITDFVVGASGDILQISIADSTAVANLGIVAAGNGSTAIAGNLVVKAMTAGTGITLAATDEIVVITGTLADSTALLASIGTGAGIITKSANNTTTNGLLVVWNNGTNTFVSTISDAGADAAMTTADLAAVNIVTLTGVLTAFDTVNFVAVA